MAVKPYKKDLKIEIFKELKINNEGKDWSKGSTLTRYAWLKVRDKVLELKKNGKLKV